MDPQMKRGMIDVCVLKVLQKGDSYGYQIAKDAENVVPVSESTLYPILRRLESAGALTVYSVEHNNRIRRYYSITDIGRRKIKDYLEDFEEIKKIYEFVKGED